MNRSKVAIIDKDIASYVNPTSLKQRNDLLHPVTAKRGMGLNVFHVQIMKLHWSNYTPNKDLSWNTKIELCLLH